ncbi:uncharacterized protein E0L32_007368 [Thyridium curvatum]|uniref:Zn(2)-C6 fungal-type domain-containing protein n=1 Tax=Thyridium curvatum TaxID=1093900 RepID=A0A507B5H1_9PEZI|nr:uncharacterized protein E0L32_007368 [Thyridium curvatum]TPX11870.1 hypothetical protein E0L32_007368 [Thyridium curvatum]
MASPSGGGDPSKPPLLNISASSKLPDGANHVKSVKRPRPVKSCVECRSRKLKCDRLNPCSQCRKSARACKYNAFDPENSAFSDGSDVDAAEPPPKRLTSRPASSVHEASPAHAVNGAGVQQITSALEELAARMEQLERLVTQRSPVLDPSVHSPGNHSRHRINTSSATIRGLTVKGRVNLRTRYFGQNSTRVLLNLFDEAKEFMFTKAKREGARDLFQSLQKIYSALQEEHRKALAPLTVFVDSILPVQKRMVDILPPKAVCDRLVDAYISTSEGLYRVIHAPTFREEYEAYWQSKRCTDGFLPRLLCMLCIGSRFETKKGLLHDRSNGVHIPTATALVRSWLDALRGKQLVDVTSLQAEVLLLHAQRMIAPRYQNTWTQLGFISRMAMTMGLHRDPTEFSQITPFVAENRRKLWFTIVDMDLHVALGCNLPNAVRVGEYTCRPPRNLNDEDIYPDMTELPPSRPIDQYTDTQMQAYAANTLPWRMRANDIICRLDTITNYQEVLEVGTKLESLLDDVNCLFPRNQPFGTHNRYNEWRMRALLDMHVRRPLLALYRPFALSAPDCPSQISSAYLKSAMAMLTYMDELDPEAPGFADVSYMYHIILKHDISQAAFSVCYYIKKAQENQAWASSSRQSPDSGEDGSSTFGESGMLWSVGAMTKAVEKSLHSLIGLCKDASTDLKDVISLAVVLASVQPARSPEERTEKIKDAVRKVLDICLQVLNGGPDKVSSKMLQTPQQIPSLVDWYNTSAFIPNEVVTPGPHDEFTLWDIDFWNPGAVPMDQT